MFPIFENFFQESLYKDEQAISEFKNVKSELN